MTLRASFLAVMVLLTGASGAAAAMARTLTVDQVRVFRADGEMQARSVNDASWPLMPIGEATRGEGVVWLRCTVDLNRVARQPFQPAGILFAGLGSYEIYWDGELIGRGGVVGGSAAKEVPGPIQAVYQIPDRLSTPTEHLLAVRLSAFHRHFAPMNPVWPMVIGDYSSIKGFVSREAWLALVALSGIVLTGAFAAAMYLASDRDRLFLLLSALCASASALLLAESWRALFGYTYDHHIIRLMAITVLTWLVAMQLVALVVLRFPGRGGKLAIAMTGTAGLAASFFISYWDGKTLATFAISIVVAIVWTTRAALARQRGAAIILFGIAALGLTCALSPRRFTDDTLYVVLDLLFVCMLCTHALDVRRQREERDDARCKSARLELEVLKRQLQPHFLMNTLTALSEWIESEPKTAVRMIESLAEEIRILADSAPHRFIAAADELRLCRAHLATMKLRRNVDYELITGGFSGSETIPPAIFHTLIENAISHSAGLPVVPMALTAESDGRRTRYVFESPAGGDGEEPREGTGTRYILARLREAWGDRWTFTQKRAGAVWRTEIEVPA